jgi:hypothetical protein
MQRRQLLRAIALGTLVAACGDRPASPIAGREVPGTPTRDPTPVVPTPSPPRDREAVATDPEAAPESEPTHPDARQLEVICRDALGLPAARPDPRRHTIAGLMVHHTAALSASAAEAPSQLRTHTAFHRSEGWPDIAYHYGVDLAGNVYELRDPAIPGDTFTDYDPAGWLLVVCEGDFDRTQPTDAMLSGVAAVLAHGHEEYGASLETISGHRDHAASACPGDHLYAALGELRAEAARLTDGGVTLARVCDDAGRERVAAIEG